MENMSKCRGAGSYPLGGAGSSAKKPKFSAGLWEEAVPLASVAGQSHLLFPGFLELGGVFLTLVVL